MKSYLLETIFFWSVVLAVPSVILLLFLVVLPYQSEAGVHSQELRLGSEMRGSK